MKYPIIVSLFAILASISVHGLPVRVAPAATDNGQTNPNTLPEIFVRNVLPRQEADDYPLNGIMENGSPYIPDPDRVSDATTLESTSESTSSPAYTAQPTVLVSAATLNATGAIAGFLVEAAKAIATTTET